MSINGSADLLSDSEENFFASFVRERLRDWKEPTSVYDNAYRSLMLATMEEYDRWKKNG